MIFSFGRHLVESTFFVLIVVVIVLFLRRKSSAAARHVLWLATVAKFIFPAAAFSLLGASLGRFLPARAVAESVPSFFLQRTVVPTALTLLPVPNNLISSALILVWLVGVAVALLMWLPKLCASLKRLRQSEDSELPLLLPLQMRVGLRRDVTLCVSDSVCEPVLLGFWKPVIMLPAGLLENLSPAELESIILHELAHAKRWDNWTAAFTHVVTCMFWFYPLLWWIEKRMHSERELACDEIVIHSGSAPKDYVTGILKICRFSLGAEVAGVSGVCDSNLKSRMEVIMSLSPNAKVPRSPRVVFASLCAIAVLFPLALGFLTASSSYGQATQARSAQSAPANQIFCTVAGIQYPEGSVVQMGRGPEQMCVRVLTPPLTARNAADRKDSYAPVTYRPEWVPTTEAIRARAATVVHLPEPPSVSCTPAQSTQANLCACQGAGQFSPGALVNSALGGFQLRCDRGSWVQTSTPNLVRK
jgi:beta-lactamase regulating signal transducer with metallopeptidase domain